ATAAFADRAARCRRGTRSPAGLFAQPHDRRTERLKSVAVAQSAAALRKNMISRRFGEILRQYRLEKGWSQSTLSLKSNVDRTYISQIECGIHSPTITVLCR